jgi:uncharacterized protein YggE
LSEEDYTEAVTPSQPQPQPVLSPRTRRRLPITLLLLLVAIAIIAGLVYMWRPVQKTDAGNQRTITVTGEAEITAEPDEYAFRPEYVVNAASRQAALKVMSTKTNEVVAKLKDLGVANNKITTDSYGYDSYYDTTQQTYRTYLKIIVSDKALAQKVQDYLLTTSPQGSVTPSADFSESTQHKLESEARDKATKDARAKAEQSARNLDFKLSKVKAFEDNQRDGFGPITKGANSASADTGAGSSPSLQIQAGENKVTYQVKVTYYLK